jgi:hypothetical protein
MPESAPATAAQAHLPALLFALLCCRPVFAFKSFFFFYASGCNANACHPLCCMSLPLLAPSGVAKGFLAGIPVGMKIADHFEKELGQIIGFTRRLWVLGTAFPHLLRDSIQAKKAIPGDFVAIFQGLTACYGGLMIRCLPDGIRKPKLLDLSAIPQF